MLNVEMNMNNPSTPLVNELHTICHHEGTRFKGLFLLDIEQGLYRSENWPISSGDPYSLKGGSLYFHDSSAKRSTFAAKIIEVIPVQETRSNLLVALVVRRKTEAGVPWRGKKPTQKNPTGGIVPSPLNHH